MNELTDKQKAFCREYIKDWNATQAAIRAGYKANSAKVTGCRLLTNANCNAEISKLTAEIKQEADIEVSEIIIGLRKIAFAPEGKASNPDRLRAFELLGKYKAMWIDRTQQDKPIERPQFTPDEIKRLQEQAKLLTEPKLKVHGQQ